MVGVGVGDGGRGGCGGGGDGSGSLGLGRGWAGSSGLEALREVDDLALDVGQGLHHVAQRLQHGTVNTQQSGYDSKITVRDYVR